MPRGVVMPHVSFSALKNWDFCPFYHKLTYVDKIKGFTGNVYTAFGSALHEACEKLVLDNTEDYEKIFSTSFDKELESLEEITAKEQKMIGEMKIHGIELAALVLMALKLKFPEYTVISAEEEIFEPVIDSPGDYDYKGFLDLVIKTPDGKYHIIDSKKRSDKIITYQLTLYKHFFCQKHNIDPTMVETYFGLLKRTAKKNRIEIFRVSSGPKKINNSLNVLNKAVYNIHNNNHPKNRLSCSKCEFRKTEWCP